MRFLSLCEGRSETSWLNFFFAFHTIVTMHQDNGKWANVLTTPLHDFRTDFAT